MAPKTDFLHVLQQENARLRDENQELHDEVFRLRQAIQAINDLQQRLDSITPQSDVFTLLNHILSTALEAVDSQDGSVQLYDEESGDLVFAQVLGTSREALLGYRLPVGEGIAGWVAANHQPRWVPDVHLEPLFSPMVDDVTGFRTQSLICVPLLDGNRVLGVIEVVNKASGEPFDEKDLNILVLVARLASLALIRAEGRQATGQ